MKSLENARQIFEGTGYKITEDERRHLEEVLRSNENKNIYVSDEIMEWCKEIEAFSKIVTLEPMLLMLLCVWTETPLYIFYENNSKHIMKLAKNRRLHKKLFNKDAVHWI